MSHSLLLIDPLTLVGRELLEALDERGTPVDIRYVHTDEDDEHQIAELAGEPGLVPPLESVAQLDDADLVVVASEHERLRLATVVDWLEDRPHARVLDIGRRPVLRRLTTPTSNPRHGPTDVTRLRLAHPAVIGAQIVVDALALPVMGGHLVAMEPASVRGREAVERLARHGAHRLQGEPVPADDEGPVLAFSMIAVNPDDLVEDAVETLPGGPWTAERIQTGCFHGHMTTLLLELDEPADESEVADALASDPAVELVAGPLSLDRSPDAERLLVTLPRLVAGGHRLSLTMAADALRLGGALTALELLENLA